MLPYEDGKWIQKSTLKSLKKKRQLLKAYLGSLPVDVLESQLASNFNISNVDRADF